MRPAAPAWRGRAGPRPSAERRSSIPLANAFAVLLLSMLQLVALVVLAELRGAKIETSLAGGAYPSLRIG